MEKRKKIGFVLGFLCFIFFIVTPPPNGMNPLGMKALAISSLMAIFWVTEAISIFATSPNLTKEKLSTRLITRFLKSSTVL